MKIQKLAAVLLAAVLLSAGLILPGQANAQSSRKKALHHRQQTKNNWRNAAIGSGAVGIYGLVKHDTALTALGAAGTAYSLSRYEHDRRSQSKIDRARAAQYSRAHIYRNGHRYTRRTVVRHGRKYYTYVRA